MATVLLRGSILALTLSPLTFGFQSVPFDAYQEKWLIPEWIRLRNDGGIRNVSVEYEANAQAVALWWVNGKLVTDSDRPFRVDDLFHWWDTPHNGIRHTNRMSSILIPRDYHVTSLKLQLVLEVNEVTLNINLREIASGKTVTEYIPKNKFEVSPTDGVRYEPGEELLFRISYTSEDFLEGNWHGLNAEYKTISNCISPPVVDIKTNDDNNGDLFQVESVYFGMDQLTHNELFHYDDPEYKVLRMVVTPPSSSPGGLLKLTVGYDASRSCLLFSGISLSRMVFLQPPPHSNFFPENVTLFMKHQYSFETEAGGNVDVAVKSLGGSDPSEDSELDSPKLRLKWKGRWLGANDVEIIDVKRLFEREAIFRFRNVTSSKAGKYLVVSKLGAGRAKSDFNLNVNNMCNL